MEHERHTATAPVAMDAYRAVRLLVLAVGPVVTLALAHRIGAAGVEIASVETVAVLLWSPLFFSIPALLLQHDRDAALPGERNALVRGIKLVPHLVSKASPVRTESVVSLIAWGVLLAATWGSVTTVLGRLLG